jgi:uncharacterized phage protein (TIGR01671 family)
MERSKEMRPIEFRAWDKEEKTMFKVGNIDWNMNCITFHYITGRKGKDIFECKSKDCILMQYMGLKDINKKKIFEGDIIKYDLSETQHYRAVVIFNKGSFIGETFWHKWDKFMGAKEGESKYFSHQYLSDKFNLEVIGNRYENPELLKQ